MPRAEIKSKQAIFTLSQLHAELAGKFAENRNAGVKIKTAMMQVEAVLQMLQPGALALQPSPRNAATGAALGSSAGRYSGARWT
jgi:hypothetical protein